MVAYVQSEEHQVLQRVQKTLTHRRAATGWLWRRGMYRRISHQTLRWTHSSEIRSCYRGLFWVNIPPVLLQCSFSLVSKGKAWTLRDQVDWCLRHENNATRWSGRVNKQEDPLQLPFSIREEQIPGLLPKISGHGLSFSAVYVFCVNYYIIRPQLACLICTWTTSATSRYPQQAP